MKIEQNWRIKQIYIVLISYVLRLRTKIQHQLKEK